MRDQLALHMLFLNVFPKDLSSLARWLVLILVHRYQIAEPKAFLPPMPKLASDLKLSRHTIKKILDELCKHKIVILYSKKRKPYQYIINDNFIQDTRENWKVFHLNSIARRQSSYQIELYKLALKTLDLPTQNFDLEITSIFVLLTLILYADKNGLVSISTSTISKHINMTNQSVYSHIKKIREHKFIRIDVKSCKQQIFLDANPIYILNLSHSYWGSEAKFGCFYVVNYSEDYSSELNTTLQHLTNKSISKKDLYHNLQSEYKRRYHESQTTTLTLNTVMHEFWIENNLEEYFYCDLLDTKSHIDKRSIDNSSESASDNLLKICLILQSHLELIGCRKVLHSAVGNTRIKLRLHKNLSSNIRQLFLLLDLQIQRHLSVEFEALRVSARYNMNNFCVLPQRCDLRNYRIAYAMEPSYKEDMIAFRNVSDADPTFTSPTQLTDDHRIKYQL